VSDGPTDADLVVKAKLQALLSGSRVEGYVRMFRLNELRAKFGL
jgi:hypothetical protein